MGLQTKITYLKKDFPEAYIKLEIIKWVSVEDEVYTETELGSVLSWEKNCKAEAIFFIYADEIARKNRVNPLRQIVVPFSFDPNDNTNIFVSAYNALEEIPEYSDGIGIYDNEMNVVN